MKKRYIIEVIIVIIALILPFMNNKTVDIVELKIIVEKYIDNTIMEAKDTKKIRKVYKLLGQEYTDFLSYGPISYMDVEEVTIFEQSDKEKRAAIVTKVNTYITDKIATFKDYGAEQTKLLEEAIIIEKDKYVICIITNDGRLKEELLECF